MRAHTHIHTHTQKREKQTFPGLYSTMDFISQCCLSIKTLGYPAVYQERIL